MIESATASGGSAGMSDSEPSTAPDAPSGTPSDAPPGAAARVVRLAIPAVYVVLALATASVWEWQHDEGFSFDISVARPRALADGGGGAPVLAWPAEPVPVTELYAHFGGERVHDGDAVAAGLADNANLTPPLYYRLLHAWAGLVGTDGLGLRLLGVLIGLASLLALRRLAALLLPTPGAPELAMGLLAVAPWFLAVNTFLRPYALGLCAMLWTTVAALRWGGGLDGPRTARRWAALWVIGSVVGLWSLYHFVFVTVAQGLLLLALALRGEGRGRRLLETVVAGVVVAAATAPLLSMLAEQLAIAEARDHWSELSRWPEDWPLLVVQMLMRFGLAESTTGAWGGTLATLLGLLVLVTYPCAALGLQRRLGDAASPAGRVARAAWWWLPWLVAVTATVDVLRGTGNVFITKYVFFLLPVLVLAATAGVLGPRRAGARTVLGTAWLALLLGASLVVVSERKAGLSRLETVAAHVAAADDEDHWVVVSSLSPGFLPPLVMTLQEAGVRHAKLSFARDRELEHLLVIARQERKLPRLTLVNYDTGAVGSGAGVGQAWFTRPPQTFKNAVRSAGWKLITVTLGGRTERSPNPGRPLHLFMRAAAKIFHGDH